MYTQLSKIFTTLSEPTRIEILSYLDLYGETACQFLRNQFPQSQPTMSHHFAELVDAGLITKQKKGTSNFYYLNKKLFNSLNINLKALLSEQSLTQQLAYQAAQSKMRQDPEARAAIDNSLADIVKNKIISKVVEVGELMPRFELLNAAGQKITSDSLLTEHDYLIISFYRGSWCPYCNLELRTLQKFLSKFHSLHAQLVAISPQKPDSSLSTQEKLALQFPVLSDVGNKVAKKFGIVFAVSPELNQAYRKFNINIDEYNGSGVTELPIPATFIVNKKGKVVFSFADPDYTKRLEPEKIVSFLARIS